jgi:hypothetical protein
VECLASEEFLGNLPLEVDAVGTVPGHGFHPLKARLSWSIPNPQTVHRQGRTPTACRFWANTGHQLLAHHARVKLLNISGGAIRMLSSAQVQTRAMARMSRADSAL